jgi:acyl carrier protein
MAPPPTTPEAMRSELIAFLAEKLAVDPEQIGDGRPLVELGFDSLIQFEVVLFLESWGLRLRAEDVDTETLNTVGGILELARRAASPE